MKQYIFSALCLVSGAFCLSSCNDDKDARPYTPDYEIVPEYTNADTWKAYEAFNEHLLDQNKFIYKSSTADKAAVDRCNGAAAIWCQPTYWDMAMNAYKRAKAEGDTQKEQKFKQLCDDLFAGNKAHYANFDFDDKTITRFENILFNCPQSYKYSDFISISDMSEDEIIRHPECETIGGYIKTIIVEADKQKWWDEDVSDDDKEFIKSLPYFDAEIFYECVGIRIK